MVLLCDGRMVCGCADPYGKRVLGDARTERCRGDLDRRDARRRCAGTSTRGGSKFCGDCPLKLPLTKDQAPPQRPLDVGAAALAAVHRVHRRLQHLVRPGVLRAGDRHHPHAPGRHARLRPVHARRGRGRPVARPHRLLQLRRGVPPQARARDVRVHQVAASRTSTSTRAPTASRSPKTRSRRLVHSGIDEVTFSIDGATPESYVQVPAARRFRQGDPQPARRWPTRSGSAAATCRSSTGATSSSRTTTATRRWTLARQMAAEIGVDRLCWEMTDHPENMFSRRFVPGSAELAAIRHEIWDDNNLGNAIPGATPRARDRRRGRADAGRCRLVAQPRPAARRADDASRNRSTRPFPAQATYGRRLVRLGAQLCAADGTLINRDYERAWLPATLQRRRATIEVPITITAPGQARALRAEVRYGQRGDRLVRGVRVADDDEDAGGHLRDSSLKAWMRQTGLVDGH